VKQFSELLGKIIIRTEGVKGDEVLTFFLDDGSSCKLYHEQDCYEQVSIEDITGDLADLLNTPILRAEESSSDSPNILDQITQRLAPPPEPRNSGGSYTWTYYKLATIKGYVDIRWFGTSNGYYSERVDFSHSSESEE